MIAPSLSNLPDVAAIFRAALPTLPIVDDAFECMLASSDIAGVGSVVAGAILRPRDAEETQAIVRVARREGCTLSPRGGGWSYSGGYTPSRQPAAIVDMRMLRDITIREQGVDAGAGTTWQELYDRLDAEGLRVPSFGPLSGMGATVGGSAAQNGGFFGTASHGAIGDRSVLASTMIAGTGNVATITAADCVDGAAAPQPLAGDCGAFGIRTAVTLATLPKPARTAFASFGFADGTAALAALRALAGLPGLGEAYLFDRGVHANLARAGFSIAESGTIAADLLSAGRGIGRIADVLRAARWNKAALAEIPWSLHVAADGDDALLAWVMERVNAAAADGAPIPDVIPRVTRSRPFRPIKALLGPDGELWLPAHGVFSLDSSERGLRAVETALSARADTLRGRSVSAAVMVVLMGEHLVIEPQLFWPDALPSLHRRLCPPDQVEAYGERAERPDARTAALAMRRILIDAMDDAGASHFQIGRTYAARPGVPNTARAQWAALKARFDPDHIMNPGVLGL